MHSKIWGLVYIMRIKEIDRCPGCMHPLQPDGSCTFCRFDAEHYEERPQDLPIGTLLQGRYCIGKVLGAGGFGITYIGWDQVLGMTVAVKEYYPEGMVSRDAHVSGNLEVYPYPGTPRQEYSKGLQAFLREAQVLAEFISLDGVVDVRDYFESNATAYIVMEYLDGISIRNYVKQKGRVTPQQTLQWMEPVFHVLKAIHHQGLVHRDVSADNLILHRTGRVKLIDFGAARSLPQTGVTVTAMFKQGFAAPEQYHTRGKQGAWTDIYGLGATIYYMLTGNIPEESICRMVDDQLPDLQQTGVAGLSERQSLAIMQSLRIAEQDRFQTVDAFYQKLYGYPMRENEAMPVGMEEHGEEKPEGKLSAEAWDQVQPEEKLQAEAWDQARPEVKLQAGAGSQAQPEWSYTQIQRELKQVRKEDARRKKNRLLRYALGAVVCLAVLSGVLFGTGKLWQQREKSTRMPRRGRQEVSQTPTPSSTVNAVVTPDKVSYMVPDVMQMPYKKAKKLLKKDGWSVKINWVQKKNKTTGVVCRQKPSKGTLCEIQGKVTLYVNQGIQKKKAGKAGKGSSVGKTVAAGTKTASGGTENAGKETASEKNESSAAPKTTKKPTSHTAGSIPEGGNTSSGKNGSTGKDSDAVAGSLDDVLP